MYAYVLLASTIAKNIPDTNKNNEWVQESLGKLCLNPDEVQGVELFAGVAVSADHGCSGCRAK